MVSWSKTAEEQDVRERAKMCAWGGSLLRRASKDVLVGLGDFSALYQTR